MKLFIAIGIAALLYFFTTSASAAGVDRRQRHQNARIHHGVKSGQLTKGEAHKLHKEQHEIRQEKRMMRADGKLSKSERQKIHEMQNNASQNIKQEKHDGETQSSSQGAEQ